MYQLFASKTTLFRISILSVNTLLISSAILQYRTGLIFLIMAGEKKLVFNYFNFENSQKLFDMFKIKIISFTKQYISQLFKSVI